jgi:hypothetical protein
MAKIDRLGWAAGLCFRSYGLRIGIRVNQPEVLERLLPLLPPGWNPTASPVVDYLYSLWAGGQDASARRRRYHLLYAGPLRVARSLQLDEVLDLLESDLHIYLAEAAPSRVFVHAGVVGWRGRALLLPGRSFSGKTSLVAALVRAGATYYSDEYAVLDAQGRVHPYPRLLSIREAVNGTSRRCPPEALGGRAGSRPLPVGLVAVTQYRPGARWRPRAMEPGRAALALLNHTVSAQRRPAAVLGTLRQVVSQATTMKGARGEAEAIVRPLLERLEASVMLAPAAGDKHSSGGDINGKRTSAVTAGAERGAAA